MPTGIPSPAPVVRAPMVASLTALTLTSASLAFLAVPAGAADVDARVLSSVTTNPNGGAVTTTFTAAQVETPQRGWQGAAASLPANPDDLDGLDEIDGPFRFDDSAVETPATREIPMQRFDVPWRGNGQSIIWSGYVDTARTVVVNTWNGTRWVERTRSRGLGADQLTLEFDVDVRHERNGVVPILVHAEDPFADDIDHDVRPGFENPQDYDFSIAHHTDTQHISRGAMSKASTAERLIWQRGYTDATQWIANNAKSRKIVYAAHTGDLVEDWMTPTDQLDPGFARRQYTVASNAQRILENSGIVTSTLPGNHDNQQGRDAGPKAMFNEFFGPERYERLENTEAWRAVGATYEPWQPGDNTNSVITFSAGGLDFVAVNLGFNVTDAEAAWADRVLKSYPDHNAIVQTHAYATASPSPDGRGAGFAEDGMRVLNKVVAPNPNVALVLAGHKDGISIGVRKNAGRANNHVVELMSNYQYYTFGAQELGIDRLGGYAADSQHRLGGSFMRLLQFDVDRSEVSVDTYSPYRNMFGGTSQDKSNRYDGREDDFRIPIQLTSRRTSFSTDALVSVAPGTETIGTATTASGAAATVEWDGLTTGRLYGWRAVSTDATTGAEIATGAPTAWFVARAGSDQSPPRLTVPAATAVAFGATVNPLQGVHARDDDGTALTRDIVVTGRVDTTLPGTQTLSYMVSDRAGNTSVATRRYTVAKPPAPVNTAVPKVTGKPQVGSVLTSTRGTWRGLGDAEVRIQWLRNGKAIPGATGADYLVTKADIGKVIRSQIEVRATGRRAVEVISGPARPGKVSVKATVTLTSKVSRKKKPLLKMRYSNDWLRVPGTVEVRVSGKKVATVRLDSTGRASVRLPKMKPGTRKVKVSYLGGSTFHPTTTVKRIKVTKPKKKAKKPATRKR